ncbi:hypothetical protein Q4Q34_05525 [Flavivirga abyssicola]|uniref:hypothetical protein n=1 Tax=Flavivirga abyssicola TaxID=3063533 RepID=UPI0026DF9865|nr:hypothetical protein [Flavivirga sp. MEBiC07777]WVK14487.1 hypothetical protein Q4Q34_05525 [Flavivirga sp. MEBiC07777]
MKILKNEIRELVRQKVLVSIFFIGIIFLDALGAILPKYLDRQITLFIPLPLICIIHIINANKINKWFLLSLVFNVVGLYHFNHPYKAYNALGIILHAIAFLIYFLILFKHYQVVNIKRVLKFSFLIVILAAVPTLIYSEGMNEMRLFYETLLYAFFVTIFVFSASLLYSNNKTKANRFLLFSTISILISSYLQGYNLFMEKTSLLEFLAIILFNLTHYFMCWYLIEKSRKVNDV